MLTGEKIFFGLFFMLLVVAAPLQSYADVLVSDTRVPEALVSKALVPEALVSEETSHDDKATRGDDQECALIKYGKEEGGEQLAMAVKTALEGTPQLNMKIDLESRRTCKDHTYTIELSRDTIKGQIAAHVKIIKLPNEPKDEFTEYGKDNDSGRAEVVKNIVNNIVITLALNIRILMLDFTMLEGGRDFPQLKKIIPNTLGLSLSVSPQIVLLSQDKKIEQIAAEATRVTPLTEKATAIEMGKQLMANYVIEGDYGEIAGALYVSVRCINLATRQIVVSLGETVDPIDMQNLQKKMSEVAANLRAIIERDYQKQKIRDRFVALAALPPNPNTRENQEMLAEMTLTASRNLSARKYDNYKVKDNEALVRQYIQSKRPPDRWMMSNSFGTDYLIILQLDRKDPDHFYVTAEYFDATDPRKYDRLDKPIKATPADVDGLIKTLLVQFEDKHWMPHSDSPQYNQFKYRGLHKELAFAYRFGLASRFDRDLYLDVGSGVLVDFGLVWNPTPKNNWRVEPLNLRLDFLSSQDGGDRMVIGTDITIANVLYRFKPHFSSSYYVGSGLAYLGVYRSAPDDLNFDGRLGMQLIFGLEKTLNSSRKLDFRIAISSAFDEVDARTLSGKYFNGGRPGGLYLTMGSCFDL